MDLLQLEHFLAVCEEKTFTRAAERVFRTQSAVSQSIKKLEEEVGAPLFARDVHDLTLTESGRVVLEYARRMIRLRDEAKWQVEALKTLQWGALSIASHESAAVYLLPRAIRRYLHEFPEIKIGIHRRPLEEVPGLVLDRAMDVGFVKEKPAFHDLETVEVHSDDMVLISAPHHPLASRAGVHIRDLGQESFVLHHQCSATAQQILRLFEQHNTPCRIVAELWSFENIKSFVQEDVGLAIVPRITVQQELRDKKLAQIPIPELNIPRKTFMIYRDQGYLSGSARQLIQIVKDFHHEPDFPAPLSPMVPHLEKRRPRLADRPRGRQSRTA